jgi:hypothetical protein
MRGQGKLGIQRPYSKKGGKALAGGGVIGRKWLNEAAEEITLVRISERRWVLTITVTIALLGSNSVLSISRYPFSLRQVVNRLITRKLLTKTTYPPLLRHRALKKSKLPLQVEYSKGICDLLSHSICILRVCTVQETIDIE